MRLSFPFHDGVQEKFSCPNLTVTLLQEWVLDAVRPRGPDRYRWSSPSTPNSCSEATHHALKTFRACDAWTVTIGTLNFANMKRQAVLIPLRNRSPACGGVGEAVSVVSRQKKGVSICTFMERSRTAKPRGVLRRSLPVLQREGPGDCLHRRPLAPECTQTRTHTSALQKLNLGLSHFGIYLELLQVCWRVASASSWPPWTTPPLCRFARKRGLFVHISCSLTHIRCVFSDKSGNYDLPDFRRRSLHVAWESAGVACGPMAADGRICG